MKRSDINNEIQLALDVFEAHRFYLPKWAAWSPENWEHCGPEVAQIKACMLGWSVTDFDRDNFREQGFVTFIERNGIVDEMREFAQRHSVQDKAYGERLGFIQKRQATAMLKHNISTKDIVNRGGGDLVVQIFLSTPDDELDEHNRIPTCINGIAYNIKAGGISRLAPGDGITIHAGVFHKFWAEKAGCIVGEIYTSSPKKNEIFLLEPGEWYNRIEEDEDPLFLLNHEYPEFR
ncbi:MAG: D-lyxose/D-mannose family sugar isomerase [Candidatus Sumerlaeia bacterium]